MNINIAKILSVIRPGAQWSLNGDTYEGLDWPEQAQTKPTLTEMEEAWPNVLLNDTKLQKVSALSASCRAEILGGFISSALGSAYKYDGDPEWQLNLAGAKDYAVENNMSVEFTCANQSTGVKENVSHTPAQMQQVFNDGAVFKMVLLSRFRMLKAQVEAMATVAEVEAVNW